MRHNFLICPWMQREASVALMSLESSTESLRQEALEARSFVSKAREQALRSINHEESSLQETLEASTTLQHRVIQKVFRKIIYFFFFCLCLVVDQHESTLELID